MRSTRWSESQPDLTTLVGWLLAVFLMSGLVTIFCLASPTILLWIIFVDRFPF